MQVVFTLLSCYFYFIKGSELVTVKHLYNILYLMHVQLCSVESRVIFLTTARLGIATSRLRPSCRMTTPREETTTKPNTPAVSPAKKVVKRRAGSEDPADLRLRQTGYKHTHTLTKTKTEDSLTHFLNSHTTGGALCDPALFASISGYKKTQQVSLKKKKKKSAVQVCFCSAFKHQGVFLFLIFFSRPPHFSQQLTELTAD